MKIGLFINSVGSVNWGTQATVDGLKYLLKENYPKSDVIDLEIKVKKIYKIKPINIFIDFFIKISILNNKIKLLEFALNFIGINTLQIKSLDCILFNGEGAMHDKSGNVIKFLGILKLAKANGLKVAAVNQTLDFNKDSSDVRVLRNVYNQLNFVSVREGLSLQKCKDLGVLGVKLIPDAVYALDCFYSINQKKNKIVFTGSSALRKNKKNIKFFQELIERIENIYPDFELVFLVNAKTDRYIAENIKNIKKYRIFYSCNNYLDAIKEISESKLMIGGRQHPLIFSYLCKSPFVPLVGNSHKNHGVIKLQNYPISPVGFNEGVDVLVKLATSTINQDFQVKNLKFNKFKVFD